MRSARPSTTPSPARCATPQTTPQVGAVVLVGAGGFFCAGGDLNQLATRRDMAPAQRRERLEQLHGTVRAIRDCAKPVVAAVEGGAAGAGMSIALACDLLVAASDAYFAVTYVRVGLTPDGGITSLLSEFVSRQVLTELCLTGERIPAARLQALGAVNRLVESGQRRGGGRRAGGAHRAGAGARATRSIKTLCRQAHGAAFDAQLDLEAEHMVRAQGDDEAAEGIGAFLGRRNADFAALRRRQATGSAQ